jgi:hypothetical protein
LIFCEHQSPPALRIQALFKLTLYLALSNESIDYSSLEANEQNIDSIINMLNIKSVIAHDLANDISIAVESRRILFSDIDISLRQLFSLVAPSSQIFILEMIAGSYYSRA